MNKLPTKSITRFKVGDKVLCIDDNYSYGRTKSIDEHAFSMINYFPRMLEVYTVLQFRTIDNSLLLAELRNPILVNAAGKSMEEVHWNSWRFIKVTKKINSKADCTMKSKTLQLDLFYSLEVLEGSSNF
jgi:hypothetical protein